MLRKLNENDQLMQLNSRSRGVRHYGKERCIENHNILENFEIVKILKIMLSIPVIREFSDHTRCVSFERSVK